MGKYIIELKRGEIAYKTVDSKGTPMIQLLNPIPYTEPDLDAIRKEAYDKAFEDAEQVAESGKKAMYQKGLSDAWEAARKIWQSDNYLRIFKMPMRMDCFTKFSASEAIEKIRAYEQEKDRQARVEYNFDEIKDVLETTAKECNVSLDEIAEVLQKMKEEP